jgi:microcystin-dependent protein
MAITQNTYTGNGSTVLYSFTFPYLEESDIKVSLNGTLTTAYTLANATTVQFNTAPANGAAIVIYRDTDNTALVAEFYPGSAIRAQDLNENFQQSLYIAQETQEFAANQSTAGLQAQITAATNTANTAIVTANAASTTANGIAGTANTALSNSSSAVTQAGNAVTTANAASATANAISAVATSAQTTANAAQTTANTAQATANAALPIAGTVNWFAMNTAPTGFLKANGAAISRTTYATLFAAIGTTFGVGNGSTTFNIPDLRGEFIRGWDDSRGVDSGRAIGTAQSDATKTHTHTLTVSSRIGTGSGDQFDAGWSRHDTITTGASFDTNSGNSLGTETRPRNIALLACIKF